MHPLLVIAVPSALMVIGMILNSVDLPFVDQPPNLIAQDASTQLVEDRKAYRQFFDRQLSS